ncbi:uncharacterized protein [Nicotiana sylvestris]|uniref:Uncharacterized protein LOC104218853 n=1 Tax=Nicotiana sylvestris TaxID=4096 RepID=A0A1U7W0D1_NICSY|nr:PREDICTED: uncharacterized protein LOC104218853 [Nicotiana sylvestris]
MAESNSENYPSLPSNYVSIAQLQERWLKEKQRKQQEQEKQEKKNPQNPVLQNHQKHKNLQNRENHSGKGWREVDLIAKEPKSKAVKITAPVVEESIDGGSREKFKKKTKKGYFRNGKPRVERDETNNMAKVSTSDVAKEEISIVESVENGGKELSKVKYQHNGKYKEVKEVATLCVVEEVGENKVDKEHEKKKGYFRTRKPRIERDGTGNVAKDSTINVAKEAILTVDNVENGGRELFKGKYQYNGKYKEIKEVATVCMVVEVGENKVDKEHEKKKGYFRKREPRVETDGKGDTAKVSRMNVVKEEIMTVDSEKIGGRELSKGKYKWNGEYKEFKEVATVCMVEVVCENKVDKKHEKEEELLVDVKERSNENVRVRGGAFHGYVDNRRDVPLIDKIEKDVRNLSLSDRRRYGGHRRPSVGVYSGDKWRYGTTSRRYELRKMLKNVWVKKGESSNGSVAETETQVDFSSQSTSQSQLCSQ